MKCQAVSSRRECGAFDARCNAVVDFPRDGVTEGAGCDAAVREPRSPSHTKKPRAVVVTSRWHAPRAQAAFRLLLRGSGVRVTAAFPAEAWNAREIEE